MWLLLLLALADTSRAYSIPVAPGESLSVTVVGSGESVVLLPGLLTSGFGYRNLVTLLEDAGYESVVIEPLGVGASGRPHGADYSLGSQAERVAAVLDTLGITEAVFVAHAVGASIVYRVAYRRPDLVAAIVSLEGGIAESATTPGFRSAMRFAPLIKLFGGVGVIRTYIRNFMTSASADGTWVTDEVVVGYTDGSARDLDATLRAYRAMADSRESESLALRLGEIRCPILLLVGGARHRGAIRADEVAVLSTSVPRFAVDTVPAVGHFIYEEAPSVVVDAVRRFRAGSVSADGQPRPATGTTRR